MTWGDVVSRSAHSPHGGHQEQGLHVHTGEAMPRGSRGIASRPVDVLVQERDAALIYVHGVNLDSKKLTFA